MVSRVGQSLGALAGRSFLTIKPAEFYYLHSYHLSTLGDFPTNYCNGLQLANRLVAQD